MAENTTSDNVFELIERRERAKVVKMVMQEDISLGMVDPKSGR